MKKITFLLGVFLLVGCSSTPPKPPQPNMKNIVPANPKQIYMNEITITEINS